MLGETAPSGVPSRSLTDRLASSLADGRMTALLRHLVHGGVVDAAPPRCDTIEDLGELRHARGPDQVAIWARQPGTNSFVRHRDLVANWGAWAHVGRIPPKTATHRVVLIGESVARGYFYDPQFTPALTLSAMLRSELGADGIDVVDLARSGMNLGQLEAVASSALALDPDIVMIFAGNNWWPTAGDFSMMTDGLAARVLVDFGVAELKSTLEARHDALVRGAIRRIVDCYQRSSVPLVWLVPEFNLGDWRDPPSSAPLLLNGRNGEWNEHWRRARSAAAARRTDAAGEHAARMIECDGGTSVAGFQLLAECRRVAGDVAAARTLLEAARDAVLWSPLPKVPRAYAVTQAAVREEARAPGNTIVDLPDVFMDHLAGGLPDRRVFLDYCHLNIQGITIAMAAAAARTLGVLFERAVPWRRFLDRGARPSQDIEGDALFLAAIHNAHWDQPLELVADLCARAVALSPDVAQLARRFTDLQTRRAPAWMCHATDALAQTRASSVRSYVLNGNTQRLEADLVDVLARVHTVQPAAASVDIEQLRVDEHASLDLLDLLDPYYYAASRHEVFQRGEWEWKDWMSLSVAHYKAYSPESKFMFVGRAGRSVLLTLACRLPQYVTASGMLAIVVNGQIAHEACASQRWGRIDLTIEGDRIQTGINEAIVRWPELPLDSVAALNAAANALQTGRYPELYPTYGEIHSFTAAAIAQ